MKIAPLFAENNNEGCALSEEVIAMLASTSAAGMALPNPAFTLIMKSVQQTPAVSHPAANKQGNRMSSPLVSSQPVQHVDVKV